MAEILFQFSLFKPNDVSDAFTEIISIDSVLYATQVWIFQIKYAHFHMHFNS